MAAMKVLAFIVLALASAEAFKLHSESEGLEVGQQNGFEDEMFPRRVIHHDFVSPSDLKARLQELEQDAHIAGTLPIRQDAEMRFRENKHRETSDAAIEAAQSQVEEPRNLEQAAEPIAPAINKVLLSLAKGAPADRLMEVLDILLKRVEERLDKLTASKAFDRCEDERMKLKVEIDQLKNLIKNKQGERASLESREISITERKKRAEGDIVSLETDINKALRDYNMYKTHLLDENDVYVNKNREYADFVAALNLIRSVVVGELQPREAARVGANPQASLLQLTDQAMKMNTEAGALLQVALTLRNGTSSQDLVTLLDQIKDLIVGDWKRLNESHSQSQRRFKEMSATAEDLVKSKKGQVKQIRDYLRTLESELHDIEASIHIVADAVSKNVETQRMKSDLHARMNTQCDQLRVNDDAQRKSLESQAELIRKLKGMVRNALHKASPSVARAIGSVTGSVEYHWEKWAPCTATCGGGQQIREVYCQTLSGQSVDEQQCKDAKLEKPAHRRVCNDFPCPKDCKLSDSVEWEPCPVCSGRPSTPALQKGRKIIAQPQAHGGKVCDYLDSYVTRSCKVETCDLDHVFDSYYLNPARKTLPFSSVPYKLNKNSLTLEAIIQPHLDGAGIIFSKENAGTKDNRFLIVLLNDTRVAVITDDLPATAAPMTGGSGSVNFDGTWPVFVSDVKVKLGEPNHIVLSRVHNQGTESYEYGLYINGVLAKHTTTRYATPHTNGEPLSIGGRIATMLDGGVAIGSKIEPQSIFRGSIVKAWVYHRGYVADDAKSLYELHKDIMYS